MFKLFRLLKSASVVLVCVSLAKLVAASGWNDLSASLEWSGSCLLNFQANITFSDIPSLTTSI